MSIFEIMTELEEQGSQLECARAVLAEVIEDCGKRIEPDSWQAYCFIERLNHLVNLLHVADGLLCSVVHAYPQIVSQLLETYREQMKISDTYKNENQVGAM